MGVCVLSSGLFKLKGQGPVHRIVAPRRRTKTNPYSTSTPYLTAQMQSNMYFISNTLTVSKFINVSLALSWISLSFLLLISRNLRRHSVMRMVTKP